jgi:hypothetical protein
VRLDQRDIAGALLAAQSLDLNGGLVEVDIDRVELLDRRQESRCALADQRAFGHGLLARAAGDRGSDTRVAQIDPRGFDIRLGLLHGCGARSLQRFGIVQVRAGHESTRNQLACAVGSDVCIGCRCLSLCLRRQSCSKGARQGRRVNLEQRLAFLDLGAFLVNPFEQDARYPRPHVRHPCRGQSPHQITSEWDWTRACRYDTNLWRRRGLIPLCLSTGSCQQRRRQYGEATRCADMAIS